MRMLKKITLPLSCVALNFTICQDEVQILRKKKLGYKAVDDYVKSNMIIGIGCGTTASFAFQRLCQKLDSGELKNIRVVPSSHEQKLRLLANDISMISADDVAKSRKGMLDLTIDSANEVDPNLCILKGSYGAFFREKLALYKTDRLICIVDESRLTAAIGPGQPIPVEISPFAYQKTMKEIEKLPSVKGCRAVIRMGRVTNNETDGTEIAVTDDGNFIVDLYFNKPLDDVETTATQLKLVSGVIEHGLFVDIPEITVMVADNKGIRLAGSDGEAVWWNRDAYERQPLERETLDNRQPKQTLDSSD